MADYIEFDDGTKYYTNNYIQKLREEVLSSTGKIYHMIPSEGFQEKVLTSEADVMIIGGKRGSGKSFIILMSALYNIDVDGFSCYGFRRLEDDIERSLWKAAKETFDNNMAEFTITGFNIKFKGYNSYMKFEHLQDPKTILERYRGVQIPHMIIDEVSQFTLAIFLGMLPTNRNMLGIKNKLIGTCNPQGPKHWLHQLIKWYINPDTKTIIKKRSGVLRYFINTGSSIDDIVWGDTKDEVYEKAKGHIDNLCNASKVGFEARYKFIKSFTFIEGDYNENKVFIKRDEDYIGNIAQGGGEQTMRDLMGIWDDSDDGGEELLSASEFEFMFSNSQKYVNGFRCATADVALTGDYFTLWAFEDKHVIDCQSFTGVLSDAAIAICKKFLNDNGIREENFAYDANGLGLFLEGFFKKSKKFNNNERASDPRLYSNQKSECAEKFEKSVRKGDYSFEPSVLRKMIGKLTIKQKLESQRKILKRKPTNNGRFEIISKTQMKQECGHSPDELEALFMREVFEGKQKSRKNIGML